MKTLKSQRRMASEVLRVGKNKVWLDPLRLKDIQEALTRADIEELIKDNAIRAKPSESGKKRRSKKTVYAKRKVNTRKREYIQRIRKLRKYIKNLKDSKMIGGEKYYALRKEAKSGQFKNLRHLKEHIRHLSHKSLEIKPEKNKKTKRKK